MFEWLAGFGDGTMSMLIGLVLLIRAAFVLAIWVMARYMA